jgi:hypothetical protein
LVLYGGIGVFLSFRRRKYPTCLVLYGGIGVFLGFRRR